jgi:hypothetical protein
MTGILRGLPGLIGRMFVGLILVNQAMGDMVLDPEEMSPLMMVNNLPDPQFKLAGAILLLFTGSLSILVVGYVVDTTRVIDQPTSAESAEASTW